MEEKACTYSRGFRNRVHARRTLAWWEL